MHAVWSETAFFLFTLSLFNQKYQQILVHAHEKNRHQFQGLALD
jgi:hypothetical protein